jgi:hypothetical protein
VTTLLELVGCVPANVILLKVPVPGTIAPMVMLSMVPVVAGYTASVPVPLGLTVIVPLTGLRLAELVTDKFVNVAILGVTLPIVMLSKLPDVVGARVNVPLTVNVLTVKLEELRLNCKVLVEVFVVTVRAPVAATVKVLLVGVRAIVLCPSDAMFVYEFIRLLPILI